MEQYYKQASINKKKKLEEQGVDWDKIRLEYETTNISTSKIAKKYNLPYSTVKDRCYRHGWVNSKNEINQMIDKKTIDYTIDDIAKKRANTIKNHYKISEMLLFNLGKSLQNQQELYTFVDKVKNGANHEKIDEYILDSINDKKLLNFVTSMEKIQKIQRLNLGIKDKKEELKEMEINFKNWLETEKLKLISVEEQETNDLEHIENFLDATKTSKEELENLFDDD